MGKYWNMGFGTQEGDEYSKGNTGMLCWNTGQEQNMNRNKNWKWD